MAVAFNIDVKGVDALINRFNAVPAQIKRARKRAITKTVKQVMTKGRREMAEEHHIPQKVLKKSANYRGRVIAHTARSGAMGSIWFGNSPINSGYVGRLRDAPNHGGAFAREFFYQQGFVATMRSGHKGVFIRQGLNRLPIKEGVVELNRADSLIKSIAQESRGLFKVNLERELNYEVNVRGNN